MKHLRCLFLLCLIFFSNFLSAHPHIFIDCSADFVFDRNGLAGITIDWLFDEMYSSTIIYDYDKDEDGVFCAGEIKMIEKESFSNLKNFSYFTHLSSAGKAYDVKSVRDFSVEITTGRVRYIFFVPYVVCAGSSCKNVELSMHDETYYTTMAYVKKDPVRFKNSSQYVCGFKIIEDKNDSYYFGQIFPKKIIMEFKRRNEQK
ncbi:DUF1007 family protein [bacterium]|nr:DUF1007 family protein [bacterium]